MTEAGQADDVAEPQRRVVYFESGCINCAGPNCPAPWHTARNPADLEEIVMHHAAKPRRCYYISGRTHEGQYVPSLVTEGESGHQPLTGNGPHAQPWLWGSSREEALRVCEQANREAFGLSPEEVETIVLSTLGPSGTT